jgi:hypothetical protein
VTRVALAAAIAAHGLIHLIGFVVPWQVAAVAGFPYRTTVLDGTADLGEIGVRVVGVIWLACAIGFIVAAVGIVRRTTWALPLTAILAIVSLVVCVVGLPETAMGIAVNVVILAGAAWVARSRTLARSRTHMVEVTS